MTVHITKETYSPSASWWEHTSPLSKYSYPKPNLNPIKPLDLLVNLQEIQGQRNILNDTAGITTIKILTVGNSIGQMTNSFNNRLKGINEREGRSYRLKEA